MASIFHELDINSSKEKVYHALTSPDGLSSWWLPGAKIAAEIGSSGIFPLSDGLHFIEVNVKSLKSYENVVWKCLKHKNQEWIGTEISFSIKETSPESVVLQFRHSGWKDESGVFGKVSFYWASLYLVRLKKMLEANL